MADSVIAESKSREILNSLMGELSNGLDDMDVNILPNALVLKKTMATFIDQSVCVSCAVVDKDFLDEFPGTDVKARIQAKIYNSLEEEMLKLNCVVDEIGAKVNKYRFILAPLEKFNLDSLIPGSRAEGSFVNLFSAYEWARDCVQLCTLLHINLQIATAGISYDDVASLKKLESSLNEIKNVKKIVLEKKKIITEILTPLSGVNIELIVVPKT